MFGSWGNNEIPKEAKDREFLPIDFGSRTEYGAINGGEAWVMESAAAADKLISLMYEAAEEGEEDVVYSTDMLTSYDERRVDEVYNKLFH